MAESRLWRASAVAVLVLVLAGVGLTPTAARPPDQAVLKAEFERVEAVDDCAVESGCAGTVSAAADGVLQGSARTAAGPASGTVTAGAGGPVQITRNFTSVSVEVQFHVRDLGVSWAHGLGRADPSIVIGASLYDSTGTRVAVAQREIIGVSDQPVGGWSFLQGPLTHPFRLTSTDRLPGGTYHVVATFTAGVSSSDPTASAESRFDVTVEQISVAKPRF